jgi:hypothetical protein
MPTCTPESNTNWIFIRRRRNGCDWIARQPRPQTFAAAVRSRVSSVKSLPGGDLEGAIVAPRTVTGHSVKIPWPWFRCRPWPHPPLGARKCLPHPTRESVSKVASPRILKFSRGGAFHFSSRARQNSSRTVRRSISTSAMGTAGCFDCRPFPARSQVRPVARRPVAVPGTAVPGSSGGQFRAVPGTGQFRGQHTELGNSGGSSGDSIPNWGIRIHCFSEFCMLSPELPFCCMLSPELPSRNFHSVCCPRNFPPELPPELPRKPFRLASPLPEPHQRLARPGLFTAETRRRRATYGRRLATRGRERRLAPCVFCF